jgi:DNA-binding Lrp family transcriptional regulator
MDALDQRLLDLLQTAFPLNPRPFQELGERLGVGEDEVLARIKRLKDEKIVRQLSAIFDSRRLGYSSTLAAFAVRPDDVEHTAAALSREQSISHSYLREHHFNLWFTLTVPPGVDCRGELDRLAAELKPAAALYLPVTRIFKIGVSFAMAEDANPLTDAAPESTAPPGATPLNNEERAAIRQLQRDLPLCPEPFAELAAEISQSAEQLLERARGFLANGVMRRYAAVLHHRAAGYRGNGMACWTIPEERAVDFGQRAANCPDVSHCYERAPAPPGWPYNFYTMIHRRTRAEARAVADEISSATGGSDFLLLFSTREFKKQRVQYFIEEEN